MSEDEADKDLEKGPDTPSVHSPRASVQPVTKEPDITAAAAPPANTEDVLKIPELAHRSSDEKSPRPEVENQHNALSTTRSRGSSVRPDPVKVPRRERRGWLASWCIIAEVEEPKDYSRRTKWIVTFVVAMAAAAAPMGSSIILPSLLDVARDFNTSATITNLSVALYMLPCQSSHSGGPPSPKRSVGARSTFHHSCSS